MNLEIEAKFLVRDLGALRVRLLAAGAVLKKPRVFERNIRYDNPWDGLKRRGAVLRLRQDSAEKITYKGFPEGVDLSQTEVRVREELEIEVSDFETAHLLIQRIGYEPRQTYEKYRETFQLGAVEVVLDEMPYGDFVELEGAEVEIFNSAEKLALNWQERINTNYLGLLDDLNAHYNLAIKDLTFDNFADLTVSMTDVLQM